MGLTATTVPYQSIQPFSAGGVLNPIRAVSNPGGPARRHEYTRLASERGDAESERVGTRQEVRAFEGRLRQALTARPSLGDPGKQGVRWVLPRAFDAA